jgi:hypothetical protein
MVTDVVARGRPLTIAGLEAFATTLANGAWTVTLYGRQ